MGFYAYKNNMHNIILGEEKSGSWFRVSFEQYLRLSKKGYVVKAGSHPDEEKRRKKARRKQEEIEWNEHLNKMDKICRITPLVISIGLFILMISGLTR